MKSESGSKGIVAVDHAVYEDIEVSPAAMEALPPWEFDLEVEFVHRRPVKRLARLSQQPIPQSIRKILQML